MLVGYVRVSKNDGSQTLDLQKDALLKEGVQSEHIYEDLASGKNDNRPGLTSCLKALRAGDVLIVWDLDRLGRNLRDLVNIVYKLEERNIGIKVLTGRGVNIDTTSANGKLIFGIFAALAEYERLHIVRRTKAGLEAARSRGRVGGRPPKMTKAKLLLAQGAISNPSCHVGQLCAELNITRQTLYRHLTPQGVLRPNGINLLNKTS